MTDKEAYWDENKPMTLTDAALLGKAAAERRVAALMQEKRELESALAAEKKRADEADLLVSVLSDAQGLLAERDRYRAALEEIRDDDRMTSADKWQIADAALKERE